MLISCRHHPLPEASVLSFFETPRRLPPSDSPYRSTTVPVTPRPHIPLRLPFASVVSPLAKVSVQSPSALAPVHTFSRVWSVESLSILPSPSSFKQASTPKELCASQTASDNERISNWRSTRKATRFDSPLKKRLKF